MGVMSSEGFDLGIFILGMFFCFRLLNLSLIESDYLLTFTDCTIVKPASSILYVMASIFVEK
jgi:hypothetical protein